MVVLVGIWALIGRAGSLGSGFDVAVPFCHSSAWSGHCEEAKANVHRFG